MKFLTTLALGTCIAFSANATQYGDYDFKWKPNYGHWNEMLDLWDNGNLSGTGTIVIKSSGQEHYDGYWQTYFNYNITPGIAKLTHSGNGFGINNRWYNNAGSGTKSTNSLLLNNTTHTSLLGYDYILFGDNINGTYIEDTGNTYRDSVWLNKDVSKIWNDGWTGKNVTLTIIDNFHYNKGHGETVSNIASGYRTGQRIYAGFNGAAGFINNTVGVHSNYVGIAPEVTLNLINGTPENEANRGTINYMDTLITDSNIVSGCSPVSDGYECSNNGITQTYLGGDIKTNSDIINLSLGSYGASYLHSKRHVAKITGNRHFFTTQFGNAYYRYGEDVINNNIVVIAAGNDSRSTDGNKDCQTYQKCNAVAVGFVANHEDKTIIVGALNESQNAMADYSTNAGLLKANYITAPGTFNNEPGIGQGTSYAAPVVSGTTALLKQKFSTVSNSDIVDIIFNTADKDINGNGTDNFSGLSDIYGHGKLDIGAAMSPIGHIR